MGAPALKTSLPDVGHLATWTVSSHKPGFDVNCLRDDDPDTFWQSDGPQPHYITLQFAKKVPVQKLAIMLNFAADDSYTPIKLLIKAGTGLYDLQDVKTVTMDKPTGWVTFDVGTERPKDGHGFLDSCLRSKPLSIYALQVVIAANHMNGKDTHVRGLRVLGAKEATMRDDDLLPFTSLAFKMYEMIR
ncbi:anaphase-promoting complex, subunit 10/DOC domain-containing protein [Cantharellus anzutake]|uniref:anaphase-promoting complex, subunit 10/DOC domain-containing protein n=1 Tax=Cantharellus anzutake TaxID=1750568 RepID=UPI001905D676|nr:anaphase-promoting complex, subunit 10/DOC domain-containing protein [Cantharellus anzutake]KAF8339699.1 anaphase-promoting complex, subunit 10/DOC domain-containing protein [Cantharellus anzutake]